MVLVPSQLYAGVPEKACVMLNHLNETVTLTLILEHNMQIRALLSDLVAKNSFYCSPFTVSIFPWDKGDSWRNSVSVDALHSDPQQQKEHNKGKMNSAEQIADYSLKMKVILS